MRVIISLLLLFFHAALFCSDIKVLEEYKFKSSDLDYILLQPVSFVATDSDTLILADAKDTNLKVYKKGKMIQVYGNKGVGPGEFIMPYKLVSYKNSLAVYDFKAQRITYLKLTEQGTIDKEFCNTQYISCDDLDFNSNGQAVLTGTYYGRSRSGHSINNLEDKTLILKKKNFMGKLFYEKSNIARQGGLLSLITVHNSAAFICLTSRIDTLIKVDMETEDIVRFQPVKGIYRPLYPNKLLDSPELKMSIRRIRDKNFMKKRFDAKRGRCMINNLYSDNLYIYSVSFIYPPRDCNKQATLLHVFKHDGTFIKEIRLPSFDDGSVQMTYYHKTKGLFYTLTVTEKEEVTDVSCSIIKIFPKGYK